MPSTPTTDPALGGSVNPDAPTDPMAPARVAGPSGTATEARAARRRAGLALGAVVAAIAAVVASLALGRADAPTGAPAGASAARPGAHDRDTAPEAVAHPAPAPVAAALPERPASPREPLVGPQPLALGAAPQGANAERAGATRTAAKALPAPPTRRPVASSMLGVWSGAIGGDRAELSIVDRESGPLATLRTADVEILFELTGATARPEDRAIWASSDGGTLALRHADSALTGDCTVRHRPGAAQCFFTPAAPSAPPPAP